MQVDQGVLHADAIEGLAGVAAVTGTEPALVVLDVAAGQVGAAVDLWSVLAEPAAELAQGLVDVLDGVGAQAQLDLGEVATRGVGELCRRLTPAGHGNEVFGAAPLGGVELSAVEQGQAQPGEDRGHVTA